MGLFRRSNYDRGETLARATRAEGRGRSKKALAEYSKLLEREPENTAVLAKVALLLARTGRNDDALRKFAICAQLFEKQGFVEKALAVYRQAAGCIPRRPELWEQIARLNVERDRQPDAIRALLDGRAQLRKRRFRRPAIRLLRQVLELDEWHYEATLDLARLLAREGQRREAIALCERLCERKRGPQLRGTRAMLFRLSPTPGNARRWLQAAMRARRRR